MEFRYSKGALWWHVFGALAVIASGSACIGIQVSGARPDPWMVAFPGCFVLWGVVTAIACRRLFRNPWVVRLTPASVSVRGWLREESWTWDGLRELGVARGGAVSIESGRYAWRALLGGRWNVPLLGLDRRTVAESDLFDAVISFYVAKPESRVELDDPQAVSRRRTEIRCELAERDRRQALEESQRRDQEDMRRGREWPSDRP